MKVTIMDGSEHVYELKDLLTPSASDEGYVEAIRAQSEANAKVIGALAALLVEKGLIPLAEIGAPCGMNWIMTEVADDQG